jgi:transposase InsO family protein
MAEVLGIGVAALRRWLDRSSAPCRDRTRRGRPEVIAPEARERIRACYRAHFGQWGPRVLAAWCRRADLGPWSASTIAGVIADLIEEPAPKPPPVRYEIVSSGVMWSEDGTGFTDRGRKKELLVVQDEHARLKLGHRLTDGPANEDAVVAYLERAFAAHGAPLVLKHDGGSIFHGERVRALLEMHQVTDLTGPRQYPQYNGKQERSMRDIKSYERAMRRHGVRGTLGERLEAAIEDLNEERPRPVLGGHTAREAYEEDRRALPDRAAFIEEVDRSSPQRGRADVIAVRAHAGMG